MTKKENILITGASGFVGKALSAELLESGHNLFLVSRDKKFKYPGAKVFHGDLSDERFCRKILKNIDTVYYLAGFKKNIEVHTRVPFDSAVGNVSPLITFLETAKSSHIREIIYTSSVVVEYASEKNIELDGYVLGKFVNECILEAFAEQTNIIVKTVRCAAVYGPGNDFNPKTSNIIPFFIHKIYTDKELVMRGNGSRVLQFIYIDDLVDNLVRVHAKTKNFFVIGNQEVVTVKDMLSRIITIMNKKMTIKTSKSGKDKPTKLATFTNLVKPKVNLDTGLSKTIQYYLDFHAI